MSKLIAIILALFIITPSYSYMEFDGNDDEISVADDPSLEVTGNDFSITFWHNFTSVDGSDTIIEKQQDANVLLISFRNTTSNINMFIRDASSNFNQLDCSASITTGVWEHTAFVKDGNTLRAYLNGTACGTASLSGVGALGDTGPMYIGEDGSFGPRNIQGKLDDLRLYRRSLNASEIEILYKSRSKLIITDSLSGWWKFDEGVDGATASGSGTVLDASGNGNHGNPTNGPTWRASEWVNYQ